MNLEAEKPVEIKKKGVGLKDTPRRRRFFLKGVVQGVGFRYTATRLAQDAASEGLGGA